MRTPHAPRGPLVGAGSAAAPIATGAHPPRRTARALVLAAAAVALSAAAALAADVGGDVPKPELPKPGDPPRPPRPLRSLKGLLPPAPLATDYDRLVADRAVLVRLGKALFWDQAVGSRGDQACASCHFHAGADPRTGNALDPGLKVQPDGDPGFGNAAKQAGSGAIAGPNYRLAAGDFPFHRLSDPNDRNSSIAYDTNDVASSAGSFDGGLIDADPKNLRVRGVGRVDPCGKALSDIFAIPGNGPGGKVNTRKVEPRNTPSSVNAAFNRRNFWDGRAANSFNGVDPFGPASVDANPRARVVVLEGGTATLEPLDLPDMSAASQAVGPPGSDFEMACRNASFADIGRRLLPAKALGIQTVSGGDSVLGSYSSGAKGLRLTYKQMVEAAFRPAYWQAQGRYRIAVDGTLVQDAGGYLQEELNFSLFFGVAVDAYERTQVSDGSPFDQGPLSGDAAAGRAIFEGKGRCNNCHDGPLFSKAATFQNDENEEEVLEYMRMGDGGYALYDNGFYDIGVRPAFEDLGIGGADPYGRALSEARRQGWADRVAADGAFKAPSLRNVGLTPPYFHNGGQKSLAEVVAFYNRGGDRRGAGNGDTTGTGLDGRLGQGAPLSPGTGSNLDPDIGDPSQPNGGLGLSADEQRQLVAFLLSLTDPRVACHKAPFDHPSLVVSTGHKPVDAGTGLAADVLARLPAVGSAGLANCNDAGLNQGDLFRNAAERTVLSGGQPSSFKD